MSAFDILIKQRNAADNAWDEVIIPAAAFSPLTFNGLKKVVAGGPIQSAGTALTTAGAGTLTAALIVGGLILRDPAGANRTDTTDTAANILTAAQALNELMYDYDRLYFSIRNTADAAETITLAGGVGVTLQGIGTLAQNTMDDFVLIRTSSTTLVMKKA